MCVPLLRPLQPYAWQLQLYGPQLGALPHSYGEESEWGGSSYPSSLEGDCLCLDPPPGGGESELCAACHEDYSAAGDEMMLCDNGCPREQFSYSRDHYSLLATHHSPLSASVRSAHRSVNSSQRLSAQCSALSTQYSVLTTSCYLFRTPYSFLLTHNSGTSLEMPRPAARERPQWRMALPSVPREGGLGRRVRSLGRAGG